MRYPLTLAALALALTGCAHGTTNVKPATGDYGTLYTLQGEVVSRLAAHQLAPAEAIQLSQDLRVAKAELDGGLTAQAEAQLATVQKALEGK